MVDFKISLPGVDVHRARLKDEVLDSHYPSPKIDAFAKPVHAGVININWTASTIAFPTKAVTRTIYSFAHGYNYVPTVFGNYILTPSGSAEVGGMLPVILQVGASNGVAVILEADNININLQFLGISAAPLTPNPFKLKIRFYVFAERGKES